MLRALHTVWRAIGRLTTGTAQQPPDNHPQAPTADEPPFIASAGTSSAKSGSSVDVCADRPACSDVVEMAELFYRYYHTIADHGKMDKTTVLLEAELRSALASMGSEFGSFALSLKDDMGSDEGLRLAREGSESAPM